MLGFLKSLFGKSNSSQDAPATAKQLRYARKIGLKIPPNATVVQLSAMLSAAEKANPKLRQQRDNVNEQKRVKEYGPELIAQEQRWNDLGDQRKWLAAVYRSGKTVKADVLSINGASINSKGKLKIDTEAGKIVNDKDAGRYVDTGKYIEFDSTNLLWSQIMDDFAVDDVDRFEQALALAQKMAKRHGG